jgi:hypothetical protein
MTLFIWKFRHGCGAKPKRFRLQPLVLLFATFSMLILVHTGAGATESLLKHEKAWTGDFDGMVERRKIRVLVPYSKTFYFLDGLTARLSTSWTVRRSVAFLTRECNSLKSG